MMAFRINKILDRREHIFFLRVYSADVLKRLQSSLQFMGQIYFLEAMPGLLLRKES